MPKVCEIATVLEAVAPKDIAEDYDNVGLLVGSSDAAVTAVMLCVDVTPDVVKEAAKRGCNLIVSHHPVIFRPIKNLLTGSFQGKILEAALKNNVNIYAAHTNLDNAKEGLCYRAAEMLGLEEVAPLSLEGGVYGKLFTTLEPLAKKVAEVFGDDTVSFVGDPARRVSSVAVVTGAGGGSNTMFTAAMEKADAFVSSEFKHNFAVEAKSMGKCLVEFSHFDSEKISIDIFDDVLSRAFHDLRLEHFVDECPFQKVK